MTNMRSIAWTKEQYCELFVFHHGNIANLP